MNLYIKSNFKNKFKNKLNHTFFNLKTVYNVQHQLTNTNLKIMFKLNLNHTFLNYILIDNINVVSNLTLTL